mgnify:CR=1 FL=1
MKKIIVVGNGMVGYKFCEKFASRKEHKHFEIVVFGEEPRPAYDRVHLSEFFENKDAKKTTQNPTGLDFFLRNPCIRYTRISL